MLWWIVGLIALYLIYVIYFHVIKPMNYWKERKVPYSKPWPVLGNMAPFVFRSKSFVEILKDMYNEFPNERYSGSLAFAQPQLVIRDPDLIKQITIKDFNFFVNRAKKVNNEVDQLFSKNLVSLTGQEWRDMRATLSPSFTSSKMRFMFELLCRCAEQFTGYFERDGGETVEIEMKDVGSRFTNDAIATAAFGIGVDSLNDKDNEFFRRGKDATNFEGLGRKLRIAGYTLCPALMRALKIRLLPASLSEFFLRVVSETIQTREEHHIVRPDMIHLLLETRKGRAIKDDHVASEGFAVVEESLKSTATAHKSLTDEDITAQALIFFFAGFDTSSTLISFLAYELGINPDVQERLREEIAECCQKCNGKVTYEALLGMKYMDMVVSEALRKWPAGIALGRIADDNYIIEPAKPDEKVLLVEKDTPVIIPVVGIHHDPKYFPNPDKFDPERFSDENKLQIVPGSYMPFGSGPRSCIASRFALMETKVLFFHLLWKFEIVPIQKTPIPLVISRKKFTMAPDEGFWLGLKKLRTL